MEAGLDDHQRELDCEYGGEIYSVRDNGAVLRHSRPGKRVRPYDDKWTFGRTGSQDGYLCIAQVRMHRIIAAAFHGAAPTPKHVVDHIDTNRRNNRPENLRWLTRLENAIGNPITAKRICFLCGSIENFLRNPSLLRERALSPNIDWMRTVTREEAQACLEKLKHLTGRKHSSSGGRLGSWLFDPVAAPVRQADFSTAKLRSWLFDPVAAPPVPETVASKTPGASQDWRTPTEFPCCPPEGADKSLEAYASNLQKGSIFSKNEFQPHFVQEIALSPDKEALHVLCETDNIKPWSVARINLRNGLYAHANLGTFFERSAAEGRFCEAQGLLGPHNKEDSIDFDC